jgi:SAM-dependent methyltransferase
MLRLMHHAFSVSRSTAPRLSPPSISDAITRMRAAYPFPDHLRPHDGQYRVVAETVTHYLPPGSRVLDFGAGGCDKTAVLAVLGFECSAYDDLGDPWHLENDNRDRIARFAHDSGVSLTVAQGEPWPYPERAFDMVIALNVLEHLHESPRELLKQLIASLKDNGYLFVTVPNAVNIRKRIDVVRGRTNYPPFDDFYKSTGIWRGHVREYTKGDLERLAAFLPMSIVELDSYHHMLWKLSPWTIPVYRAVTTLFPSWRDSWMLVARISNGDGRSLVTAAPEPRINNS